MKQIALLIINTLSLIFALVMNYLSGTGAIAGRNVGEVSRMYDNLFTPSGYAFAIWGLIYLLLMALVLHQWYAWLGRKEDRELKQTGIWFALSNVANGTWIVAWLNLNMAASLVIMVVLLFSLIMLTWRLNLERWDAPLKIIAFVWWPITVYLGWIIVATVANTTVFLVSQGWDVGWLSEETWVKALIVVASVIYLLLVYYRNMREASAVGIWALIAIAVRRWSDHPDIAWWATLSALVLFFASAWQAWHNRTTLPVIRRWYKKRNS